MANNIIDLNDTKTNEQLQRELNAAIKTIDRLLKDLSQKAEKIKQLETLINQNAPVLKKEQEKIVLNITPEEEIAQLQLERLRTAAKNRTLTLEETRMFDLLVKNKRLTQDESTINLSKSNYRDVSDALLIEAAIKNDSDDSEHNS